MVIVTTSNTVPDDLYRDGLNRQLFLPFIALLGDASRNAVPRQRARLPPRLHRRPQIYITPLGVDADAKLQASVEQLTDTRRAPPYTSRSSVAG